MSTAVQAFKDVLASGVSRAAASVGGINRRVSAAARGTSKMTTPHLGKRGTPHRRIIDYQRLGPFRRIINDQPGGKPIVQAYFQHTLMHATKGMRRYNGGARLPIPAASTGVHPSRSFYGSHYGMPRN